MSSSRRGVLRALGALVLPGSIALGGCGFELRRAPKLPFRSIALVGFAPRSPLAQALRDQLALQVEVVDDPARADVVLQALLDLRDKVVVAQTAASQVREFELRVRITFLAHAPGGRELLPRTELMLTRDLSYAENNALAKEQEEAELYRDMQTDIVQQVLRRLASVSI
ncbi:MAG: hypothetical protein KGL18_20810 [Burkholderiales bacterium]|nr:hypothetical protein [Burkholderiales bacterium]MDE1926920.1 hypothetical protein [Burkholderiales bacterium]MDE2158072.1 hypothetical protein [Burkholderiales bacterium]MDE2505410.1 hypothetical protein [Burkholderiales bacterium]